MEERLLFNPNETSSENSERERLPEDEGDS